MATLSGMTKSQRIFQVLESEAMNGDYSPNGQLSTIREMAKRFQTTTATICKVVDNLARRGIIEKQHGRGLFVKKSQATKSVAIVLDSGLMACVDDPFYSLLLSGLETAFSKRKWACRYFLDINSEFGVHNFDFALANGQIDAVVFASQWFYENRLCDSESKGVPCLGFFKNGENLKYCVTDNVLNGNKRALKVFQNLGRKKIAMITAEFGSDWNEYGRRRYGESIEYAASVIGRDMIKFVPLSGQSGYQAMKDFWQEKKPDGVIVSHEVLCGGVVPAVLSLGLRVPEDLIIASHVIEGSNRIIGLPIIELRVSLRDKTEKAAEMIDMINAGQNIECSDVSLNILISNPFTGDDDF